MSDTESQPGLSGLARICSFAVPARCPFCTAIASPPLEVGDEVIVLSGVLTGLHAKDAPVSAPDSPRPGEIYLQPLDGAPSFYLFNQRLEIAQRLPGLDRPEWFPPFSSLRDAADLHDEILRFCLRHDWDQSPSIAWLPFYALLAHTWRRRLPIEGEELAVLLGHHGLPESCRPEVVNVFSHCRDALVLIVGRRPIKKKRADYVRRRARRLTGSAEGSSHE